MKSSILEIKSVPYIIKDNGINIAKANRRKVQTLYQQIFMISKSYDTKIMIEVGFLSEKSNNQIFKADVRMLITIDSYDGNYVAINSIEQLLMQVVRQCGCEISKLEAEEATAVEEKIVGYIKNDLYALVKNEKMITSDLVYPGAFYFTDIFPTNEGMNDDKYYNDIVNAMSNMPDTYFAIQLSPYLVSGSEDYCIGEMRNLIQNAMNNGSIFNGQVYRESFLEETLRVYTHFSGSNDMFEYNIIICSQNDTMLSAIQFKEILARKSRNALDIEVLKVYENIFYDTEPDFKWLLNNTLKSNYRNQQIWNSQLVNYELFGLPFLCTSEEAVGIFEVPLDDGSLQGMRSHRIGKKSYILPQFDNNQSIYLGNVETDGETAELYCPIENFAKHGIITGMPGFGKTTMSIDLLLQFYQKNIPFLAIEPTKTEYRVLINAIPNLQIFTPGNSGVAPYIINPFLPPKSVKLEQYIPSLVTAFKASFSMPNPLDQVFLKAIRRAYLQYGWKEYSTCEDRDVEIFGLYEFVCIFKDVVKEMKYDSRYKGNLESAGILRLMDLIEQNGNVFDNINSISIEDILNKPTIIELNAIDNKEQKALIITLLLIQISVYIKSTSMSIGKLKNIILMDESHVILEGEEKRDLYSPDASGKAISLIKDMIAELRSYGIGMIIADQKPSVITKGIIANTDFKLSYRLMVDNEREIIRSSTNMSDVEMNQMAVLPVGRAFVSFGKLDEPVLIKTRDIRKVTELPLGISDDEVREKCIYWNKNRNLLIPYNECKMSKICRDCNIKIRSDAEYYAAYLFNAYKSRIDSFQNLKMYMLCMHEVIIKQEMKKGKLNDINRLCNCVKIKFLRKCLLELDMSISKGNVNKLLKYTLVGGKNE